MIDEIARAIQESGGKAYYCGGYVRDKRMGLELSHKDIDIEVHGLDREALIKVLSEFGESKLVGKSFPVIKLKGHPEWDFTLPVRAEATIEEACERRDFTMNSMVEDILTGELIDPFNGQEDIVQKIIRHTSKNVFKEDPLRVYRAIQLAARFDFRIAPETMELMRQVDVKEVQPDRIYEELRKLLLLSPRPSVGLEAMRASGILQQHPLLFNLIGCEQSPVNHPEGDVWVHTLMVVDEAARLKTKSSDPEAYLFAALVHDLGKPATTSLRKGKITAYGHDVEGAPLARAFLQEMTSSKKLIEKVVLLVREHMNPVLLYKQREQVGDKAIRKLISRVNLKELLLLSEADYKGRGIERHYEEIRAWFEERLAALGLSLESQIQPLIQGRDLLELGLVPGVSFAEILDMAWEMQMEGSTKQDILQQIEIMEETHRGNVGATAPGLV